MLLDKYRTKVPERKEFDPVPEDTYQVQISDINLKTKMNSYRNEEEEVLDFEFVILNEGKCRGRRLWKNVRPVVAPPGSSSKPSWLYVIASKALERELEFGEIAGFEPNSLIGRQLRVVVNCAPGSNGKTYNNIIGFQVKKGDLEPFEKNESPVAPLQQPAVDRPEEDGRSPA
jgi:hypothetical protein